MSGAGRSSPLRYIVWVLGVRAETVRVSENHAGHMSFVFHYWWMDCSFLRLRGVLLWSIVGITADRAISSNFVGCKPISPIVPGRRML